MKTIAKGFSAIPVGASELPCLKYKGSEIGGEDNEGYSCIQRINTFESPRLSIERYTDYDWSNQWK